jgi:hypothetical protein
MSVTPQLNSNRKGKPMLVRSLCKHNDTSFREEGEEFEHNGPLYEHIVPVDETEPPEPSVPASREQKPTNPAKRK